MALIDKLRGANEHTIAQVLRVIAVEFIEARDVDSWVMLHEVVETALSSADPATRRYAVKVALVNDMLDLSGTLARLAERDGSPVVRLAALSALKHFGSDEEIEALTRITRAGGPLARSARQTLAAVRERAALINAA